MSFTLGTTYVEFRMQQAGGDVIIAALEKDGFITWDEPGILFREKGMIDKFVAKYPVAAKIYRRKWTNGRYG